MSMHFRNKSVADTVVERIMAISDSVRTDKPLPEPKGSATINIDRNPDGGLLVTKSFENGETEILTFSSNSGFAGMKPTQPPEGLVQIGGDAPIEEQLSAGIEAPGIVENAALGGDSLNALLKV